MDILNVTRMGHKFYAAHDEWYWETFWKYVQDEGLNHAEAYEKTEVVYFEKFAVGRFCDYGSFRVGKHRKYNGNKKEFKDPDQLDLFKDRP